MTAWELGGLLDRWIQNWGNQQGNDMEWGGEGGNNAVSRDALMDHGTAAVALQLLLSLSGHCCRSPATAVALRPLLSLSGHSTIGCMNLLGWAKEGSVTLTHPPWIRDTQLDLQLGRLHARLPLKVTSNPSLDDISHKKRRLSRCAQQSWCRRIIFSN